MRRTNSWRSACDAITSLGVFVALLSWASLAHASAPALSLDDCQALARKNYPLIRQYELIEKSREFTISNANKAYLPQLSITGIGGYVAGLPSFMAPGSDAEK